MVNRQKELDELLEKLRKTDPNNSESDIDLILSYLERYLADPKSGGKSKKLLEFQIDREIETMNVRYKIHWIAEPNLDL